MQGVTDVEKAPAGVGEALARGVGEPGGGDGAQRGGVAQAAAGLLEVGFEEELQLALALGALGAQLLEFGETFRRLVAPVGEDGRAQSCGEAEVAGEVPGVQQPELDLEVLARGLACLGGRTDGVVEVEAEVPDRIPDAVGQGGHRAGIGAAVVQEQQVEVAARGELAAAVAADGDERDAAQLVGARVEQTGQPVVGQFGEGRTAAARTAPSWRRRSRAAA